MRRFQSLQGQFLILIGVVLFATLMIVAVTVFALVSTAEQQIWVGRQEEAGRYAATQARNYIELAHSGIQFIAQLDDRSTDLDAVLESAIGRNEGYLEIIVVNAQGGVVHSASTGEPLLTNLFTIAQSNWFRRALTTAPDDLYVSEVQISPANIPYVIISTANRSGGVVALRLSLSVLGDIVSDLRFGMTGMTYVAQSAGIIAAHPDPEVIQNFVSLAGRPEFEAVLKDPQTPWTGSYVNFQGEAVIGTVSVVPETNLIVITEVTQAEATANSRSALLLLSAITVLFWSGATVLILLVIRRLVFVPLAQLQDGASKVELGNLGFQVKVLRSDEIGLLTKSFNEMARSLQTRANEREQLITNLQAAKRLAEENSRLKSEFLSTMSHELRTPMNAIEGFTSIILNRMGGVEFNDETERYITRVNINSKRLLQLINDFLDLSRVESGRLELAHQPFSPAELARRWQAEISVLAEKKDLDFELTLDAHLPEKVYGDEEAVSKVALNLLSNAIKFTEEGKVSLTVANGGDNWRITVSDTGIGIPPHAREYVFEEFRQVDSTSKRKYGGTGLGLAIVQKYTRTMGGTVTLQSEVGKGSTFILTLPLETQLSVKEN
jgi:signal transduction histidine kinase